MLKKLMLNKLMLTSSMLKRFKKRKLRAITSLLITVLTTFSLPGLSVAEESSIPAIDCMIEPNVMVDLSSSVVGVLDTLTVDKSDEVKKGQIIATLKSDIEQVNVRRSRERLKLSSAEYRRAAELYREKAITKSEKEQADNDKNLAQLELKHAITNLNLRKIKSPIDGVVVKRYANPGEFVETRPILQLAQLDPLRIEVVSPVANYGKIIKGMQATIFPEFGEYENLIAKVVVVDKVIDAASGTFSVRLELDNKDHTIPGGLKCSAKFMPITVKKTKIENEQSQKTVTADIVNKSSEAVTTLPMTNDDEAMLCQSIGPYKKQKTIKDLLKRLNSEVKKSTLRVESVSNKTYLVESHAFDSLVEREWVKQRMNLAGFTDTAFLNEVGNQRLALGVFRSKLSAMQRIDALREKGFDVKIRARQKKVTKYWADIIYSPLSADAVFKHTSSKYRKICEKSVKLTLLSNAE